MSNHILGTKVGDVLTKDTPIGSIVYHEHDRDFYYEVKCFDQNQNCVLEWNIQGSKKKEAPMSKSSWYLHYVVSVPAKSKIVEKTVFVTTDKKEHLTKENAENWQSVIDDNKEFATFLKLLPGFRQTDDTNKYLWDNFNALKHLFNTFNKKL